MRSFVKKSGDLKLTLACVGRTKPLHEVLDNG